jgi:tRNA G37 N-methylase Trm5
MNLKERNVPSAKIYISPKDLEERKKVCKFASRNEII